MRGEEGLERFVKAQKTDYEESLSEMKLRSSMTLFHLADPSEDIFKKVLEKFFSGKPDPETVNLINVK
jgi:uncharacterized protein (DUF1810 family)